MLRPILVISVVLLVVVAIPRWLHARHQGYHPCMGESLTLAGLLIMVLLGWI